MLSIKKGESISLYQWEYGQSVLITDLTITEDIRICFSNQLCQTAIVVVPEITDDGVLIAIPNVLLEQKYSFTAYIEDYTDDSATVNSLFTVNVTPRQKPSTYISSNEEVLNNPALNEYNENAKKALDTLTEIETNVEETADEVEESKTITVQAMTDLLAMLGSDIATLVNGKIPVSQIPSIATTELYTAESEDEQNALEVQNGDICIRTDENKSYIYSDGWVYLTSPTDYASTAGYATTAGTAESSTMINNKRIVSMTKDQYDTAVLDDDTFYFVTEVDDD